MPNLAVSLLLRVRLSNGTRKYLPTTSPTGKRLPAGCARVGDRIERFATGSYYLAYRSGGKLRFENVGRSWDAAIVAQANRETALQTGPVPAKNQEPVANASTASIAEEIGVYVGSLDGRAEATRKAYKHDLEEFARVCRPSSAAAVTRQHLLGFKSYLLDRGLDGRTVRNEMVNVATFLRVHDMAVLKRGDLPAIEPKFVRTLCAEEIRRLMAVSNERERLVFGVFLNSGMRDQEVAHLSWLDVDWESGKLWVRAKPSLCWKPKNRKARAILVPDSLLAALKAWRPAGTQKPDLVFPNEAGRPDGHFLRTLKYRALEAGLNCGECTNKRGESCRDHPVCEQWYLHRFRKHFATTRLREGHDIDLVRQWMGHADFKVLLLYLAEVRDLDPKVRERVNASALAAIA